MDKSVEQKMIVFGTGEYALRLSDSIPGLVISYYVDNDRTKWGTEFNGKLIKKPSELLLEKADELLIIIAASHYLDISSQLKQMGFQESLHYISIKDLNRFGYFRLYEDGHYYSPYPLIEDIKERESELFDRSEKVLQGIDLNTNEQISLLHSIGNYFDEFPYLHELSSNNLRYSPNNLYLGLNDAICLYGVIRLYSPKRIIEVGSGYSSAVMLDTNSNFYNNNIKCTFIEPYPDRLLSLLHTESDHKGIISKRVQDVDLKIFDELEAGDILFIDSSHVSKIGSDVNKLIFEILPRLNKGVIIHFHDIFYPFEPLSDWVYEGRAWNETHILRAFLQYNESFKIKLWNHYLSLHHFDEYRKLLPQEIEPGGGSIWMEKC
ncbi:class I SAM-dependent methyltransferase [Cohnella phaseoli]|uniref:Methyltransferase family protein n=1 Tax=Cohnella phaseoli TaxID=456490 RepID=A0A3D9KBR2_9BACL|nr:class I SAM-dependent methyltransferase [Cohnella phaseoli]RED83971.1 methyltransferase family protein [Cohnella phaseoli]